MNEQTKRNLTEIIISLIHAFAIIGAAYLGKSAITTISAEIRQTSAVNLSVSNQLGSDDFAQNLSGDHELFGDEDSESPVEVSEKNETNQNSEICVDSNWRYCWAIDDAKKQIVWVGDSSINADIGMDGEPLTLIRNGYSAKVFISQEMTINICVGAIDGEAVLGSSPVEISLNPGTHIISSPGPSGGFRIKK